MSDGNKKSTSAIKSVYVVHGTDELLRDEAKAGIIEAVLGDADRQMCLSTFDAEAELADVLDDLRTPPFLGERRLVIIDAADAFVSAHRQALEAYVQAPAPTGVLGLMLKSFPSNTRLAKLVNKVGYKTKCDPPTGRDVVNRIRQYARSAGKSIEPAAAALMADWLGNDLARIRSEMDKLALYALKRDTLTIQDVSDVVVATAGVSPWALTDAITAADSRKALTILNGLLTQPGEEYKILGLIGWHLRRVLQANRMRAAGRSETEVFKTLKIWKDPGAFRRLLARRGLARLGRDLRRIIRADLAIKTGADGKAALQQLVVALC